MLPLDSVTSKFKETETLLVFFSFSSGTLVFLSETTFHKEL